VTADEGMVSGRMTKQNGGAEKLMVCIPELVERLTLEAEGVDGGDSEREICYRRRSAKRRERSV